MSSPSNKPPSDKSNLFVQLAILALLAAVVVTAGFFVIRTEFNVRVGCAVTARAIDCG